MKKRYTVLGVVTALLPNLYAYAGESQASSMAGGASTSQATTQEGSSAANQSTNQAQGSQNSSASQQTSTSASTQSTNQGAAQPYLKPVGSSTAPVQGRGLGYTMPAEAKPVVKNFRPATKTPKKGPVTKIYR